MSQQHIDTLNRGFAAFNRGDWDAALEFVADDVVWIAYLARMDGETSIYGRAALKRTWVAQRESLGGDAFKIQAEEVRDLGAGTVLVPVRVTGQGTNSGVPIAAEYVQLWTFREGLAVRVDNYADEATALKAVAWER